MLTKAGRDLRSICTLNRDREYAILRQMLQLQPEDSLLDVGSGDGFWSLRFARHCRQVVGLEPSLPLVALAQQYNRARNLFYGVGVAEAIPFPTNSFDKVVSVSSVEHFQDPAAGITEMARVLKPGGLLAISVDSLLPANSTVEFRRWHSSRHFVTKYFSQDDVQGCLEAAGLTVDKSRTRHLFRSDLAARVRSLYIRKPRRFLMLFPLFYPLVRLADKLRDDMPGQILVVTGQKPRAPKFRLVS